MQNSNVDFDSFLIVSHFYMHRYVADTSIELIQGPLITDGRNSNEMWFSKISLWRMDLGISIVMKISLPNLNDMDLRL